MPIDRAGWPFVAAAVLMAFATVWAFGPVWALPFAVLAGFFLFFFRDPERAIPREANLVVSPADGRVMIVGTRSDASGPPGEWRQISIFLSPLDVHVNRAPVSGRITRVEYHAGKFLPAYRDDAGTHNEWTEVWFDHAGTAVVCRQIVGILARRIVTRLSAGQFVQRGERFGIMKFGSRIDLFLPLSANVIVTVGDRVVGGETTLASLSEVPAVTPSPAGAVT
jgi:phosphatidylserine decarboxylase